MIRLLVCGGRDYSDVPFLWRELDRIHAETPVNCLMEGASDDVTGPYIGADYWAHQWALAHEEVDPIRFHAEWKTLGRSAGPIRNRRMITEGWPDTLLAMPGGIGTADMIKAATKAGGIRIICVSAGLAVKTEQLFALGGTDGSR